MSIGEASNPDDAHLFEEAISGDCALLGWEDIDWSDEKFASRDAIIEACKVEGRLEGHADVNALSGAVQMPHIFRNLVKEGDIVIVSKGNLLFRAIGVFTGNYEYHPRPDGSYAHRRAVQLALDGPSGLACQRDLLPAFLHEGDLHAPRIGTQHSRTGALSAAARRPKSRQSPSTSC